MMLCLEAKNSLPVFCVYEKKTFVLHFINPLRIIWAALQQLQEQHYPVLHMHAGSFVFP